MLVKIFINTDREDRNWELWKSVIDILGRSGYEVKNAPELADLSIVLSGKFENPLCFHGKRVIVFHPPEWEPKPWGAKFYGSIIQHYYNGYINMGNTTDPNEITEAILTYIKKAGNGDKER